MINFKVIRWKNFISTGNAFTEIRFDKSPNTLVIGENGAGKSTMLDALCFALYGRAFRKVKKDQLVNSINQRDCLVELEFEAYTREYKVVRGIKPNVFEIYQDGVLLNQTAAVKDYQDILERSIVRMNLKSFSQIVILGSASFVPFMQLPTNVRREVIEDLLDIRVFSTMSNLLKDKQSDNKYDLMSTNKDIENNDQILGIQTGHLEKMQQNNATEIASIEGKILQHRDNIDLLDKKITENIAIRDALIPLSETRSLEINLADAKKRVRSLQESVAEAKDRILFFEHHDECPTCNQGLPEHFKSSKTLNDQADIHVWKTELDEQYVLVETHQKAIDRCETIKGDIMAKSDVIADMNRRRKTEESHINFLGERLAELKAPTDVGTLEREISKLTIKKAELNETKKKLLLDRELQNVANVILRDSGIKTRILKTYIPVINTLVNKYLAAMDFFVKFELNEMFEESILSRHRDEFTYESFSEGEKMRIDLALLFTWRTIARMKNSASTNLLILDEVFDASLDANGCDEFLKMIHGLENANVFVISHKGDLLQDKFRASIRFEKHANFSRIAA